MDGRIVFESRDDRTNGHALQLDLLIDNQSPNRRQVVFFLLLDLREVTIAGPVTTIRCYAFWGGIDIRVGPRTKVVVDGVGIMGGFAQSADEIDAELDAGSPVLRVTGVALMGGVNVQRREPRV